MATEQTRREVNLLKNFYGKALRDEGLSPIDALNKVMQQNQARFDANPELASTFSAEMQNAFSASGIDSRQGLGSTDSSIAVNELIQGGDLLGGRGQQNIQELNAAAPALKDYFAPKEMGGFGKTLGKIIKFGVPAAIGTIATAGLGSALGAGLSGAGGAATTATTAAPVTGISAGSGYTGGGIASGLGSSLGGFAKQGAITGALQGGIGGLAGGGGFSDALKGAAFGGLTGGYAPSISSGLGLQGATSQGFQGALKGASGGIASGNLQTAGLGALLGGGSSYLQAGGDLPGLGRYTSGIDPRAGALANQGELFKDIDFEAAARQGTGVLGNIGNVLSGARDTIGGVTESIGGDNMGLSDILKGGIGVYSAGQQDDLLGQQRDILEKARLQAEEAVRGQLSPYQQAGGQALGQLSSALSNGFDFREDPGYQFRLAEGQQALERSLASQGLSQSGAALKAAQQYGQGLASQTYDDAFRRYLNQNQQLSGLANIGYGASSDLASSLGNLGLTGGVLQSQALGSLAENEARRNASLGQLIGGFF